MENAITLGDPRMPRRFWAKVAADSDAECWLWAGALHRKGYGQFWHDSSMKQAHRVAYEALVGSIPGGLQLDHRCRNRACVNPSHLAPVTNKENAENRAPVNRLGNPRGIHFDDGRWFGKVVHEGRCYYTRYYKNRADAEVEVGPAQ